MTPAVLQLENVATAHLPEPGEREVRMVDRSTEYFAPIIERFLDIDLSSVTAELVLDFSQAPR